MVNLVKVSATEIVKKSWSLLTVLIWLLEALFLRKTTKKLMTFKSGNCATVIDRAMVQKKVKNIKVIPEKNVFCFTDCSPWT